MAINADQPVSTPRSAPAPKRYRRAGASWYSPADGSTNKGYKSDNLDELERAGIHVFAELMMGRAAGGLPYKQPVEFRYNGKSIIAYKYDIGLGGGPVHGYRRTFDFYGPAARALGIDKAGLAVVEYRILDKGEVATAAGAAAPDGSTENAGLFNLPGTPFILPFNPLDGPGAALNAAKDTVTVAKDAVSILWTVAQKFLLLFQSSTWLRIGKVLAGVILAGLGIYYLITGTSPREAAANTIDASKKAAETAAAVSTMV